MLLGILGALQMLSGLITESLFLSSMPLRKTLIGHSFLNSRLLVKGTEDGCQNRDRREEFPDCPSPKPKFDSHGAGPVKQSH